MAPKETDYHEQLRNKALKDDRKVLKSAMNKYMSEGADSESLKTYCSVSQLDGGENSRYPADSTTIELRPEAPEEPGEAVEGKAYTLEELRAYVKQERSRLFKECTRNSVLSIALKVGDAMFEFIFFLSVPNIESEDAFKKWYIVLRPTSSLLTIGFLTDSMHGSPSTVLPSFWPVELPALRLADGPAPRRAVPTAIVTSFAALAVHCTRHHRRNCLADLRRGGHRGPHIGNQGLTSTAQSSSR